MKITMSHGGGGRSTKELIDKIFANKFSNPVLNEMEDCAVIPGNKKIAMTTDSFVVTPLIYPGGDIGRLCICGTVNDLLMRGAVPQYITCGFIIEEGTETELLEKIADSMAATAKEAGVIIVAGDTKVIEGNGGLYINTAGVGFVDENINISGTLCKPGDAVILSGSLGEHHATVLSCRMGLLNTIESDNAPLNEMVMGLLKAGIHVHAMRDVTRGGLGTVLNELADAGKCAIELNEKDIPVADNVKAFTKILGLNILHMGNEGKMVAILPEDEAEDALAVIRKSRYGENAAIIGKVTNGSGVCLNTALGGVRTVTELIGEGLPRIC